MKISDYIVDYLINKGVKDVFGYPGGMVTHFMDSLSKRSEIHACLTYHEQGAAFAACGYAQAANTLGVAFATSGPGATNLITGICNAYYESIPVLFITGQVNTSERVNDKGIRQCGFQETDIVSMVNGVTKYAVCIDKPDQIRYHLDRAIYEATTGRPGAVLLDIPMDVFRTEVNPEELPSYKKRVKPTSGKEVVELIRKELLRAEHPVFLFGNGINIAGARPLARRVAQQYGIPVVTSMLGVGIPGKVSNYFGFIGAYGNRTANFIVAKADLVISLGSRLDIRQVGKKREAFASKAKILRVDIDNEELTYKVHDDEIDICMDVREVLFLLDQTEFQKDYSRWVQICNFIRKKLDGIDEQNATILLENMINQIPEEAIITTDVGQNQVWTAQAVSGGTNKVFLFSGSMGAMGYSIPAAIGACLATGKPVYAFTGDGGLQMNMQELQVIAREHLPIVVILINNNALGMIRHFQEMYFNGNYYMTVSGEGFSNPNYRKLADVYGMHYYRVSDMEELKKIAWDGVYPIFIEIVLEEETYVYPKLEYGKPNQDQEPLLDREVYKLLMNDDAILATIEGEQ